jgi:hypothetical protein
MNTKLLNILEPAFVFASFSLILKPIIGVGKRIMQVSIRMWLIWLFNLKASAKFPGLVFEKRIKKVPSSKVNTSDSCCNYLVQIEAEVHTLCEK